MSDHPTPFDILAALADKAGEREKAVLRDPECRVTLQRSMRGVLWRAYTPDGRSLLWHRTTNEIVG